jgi:hypothetical protein
VRAPWFLPSPDYRLTCPCAHCCLSTGREPSRVQAQDRSASLRLIERLGWRLDSDSAVSTK